MLAPEIRCVVGIDIAKQAHVVCALEAPSGEVRHQPSRIEASAEGYAQLRAWLERWGTPETILLGLEATGPRWEPLDDTLTHAGYTVLRLNPPQTASWAASLGLRAKTDGLDAHPLARGRLAGLARASCLPSETVQALRALTRARRDLIESRTAARQRLHDELVVLFPAFVRFLPTLPGRTDLGEPAVLHLLSTYRSARAPS
jgi:transposase